MQQLGQAAYQQQAAAEGQAARREHTGSDTSPDAEPGEPDGDVVDGEFKQV
jgi:hypothetical protein